MDYGINLPHTAKKKEFALDKLLAQLDTEEAKEELRNLAELIGDSPGESESSAAMVRVICVIFYTETSTFPTLIITRMQALFQEHRNKKARHEWILKIISYEICT